jgi:hypothetical protein
MTPPGPTLPASAANAGNGAWARPVAALLAALLAVKLAGLFADPVLRFFMGDSASYLHTALTGWRPPDRSFTYGWLVGATAIAAGSSWVLLGLQALFGIATALSLAGLLIRGAAVRPALAALAALALAVEPAQVFYERMLMAESAGTLAFVLQVCALAAYAHRGQVRWMALAAVAGTAAVSLRLSLLPVVLGLAATVPVVAALWHAPRGVRAMAVARHLGFALLVTAALHAAYQSSYRRDYGEASYLPANGMMRIGLVAPLVRAEHFEGTGVDGTRVLAELGQPLADTTRREAQVWAPDGLYQTLARHTGQPEAVARVITGRALRSDPLGWLALGLGNVGGYFDPDVMPYRLEDDLGRRPPDEGMLATLQSRLAYDARGVAASSSPATHWFALGAPWLVACFLLLAPLSLLALALHWRTPARAVVSVLCLASLGLVAGHLLFAHIASLRYLHPMPWFVLANLALLVEAGRRRRAQGPRTAR